MLELEGLLTESPGRSPFGPSTPSVVASTREALDRAEEDDKIEALLLRIRSPGGTVSASDALLHTILQWKRKTGKPVVAHMQGVAASGGYFIAMGADHVVAQPSTITGSIGVIMAGVNLTGLMEKIGVSDQTMTSGAYKDAGSPFRAMRPDEREQLQGVINDLQSRFLDVVDTGRPSLDRARVAELADGRVYTARQALEAGLIDDIGFLDDTIDEVERRIGVEEARVIVYHRPREYVNNLYSRSELPPIQLVNVHLLDLGRLLEPGFYFIWPPALGLPPAH
jgi:protease-4